MYEADLATWLYLGGSALSGLVLGDTCYFRSLQILGPRRTLVVTTLVPPIGALCGWFLLSETLSSLAWAGIGLTVGGVIWVIREKSDQDESQGHFPGSTAAGVRFGLLACAGQALAAALAKGPMRDGLGALEATLLRMVLAVFIGTLAAAAAGKLPAWTAKIRARETWLPLIPASFFGTYLGVWLCMYAYEHTKIGVATHHAFDQPDLYPPARLFRPPAENLSPGDPGRSHRGRRHLPALPERELSLPRLSGCVAAADRVSLSGYNKAVRRHGALREKLVLVHCSQAVQVAPLYSFSAEGPPRCSPYAWKDK